MIALARALGVLVLLLLALVVLVVLVSPLAEASSVVLTWKDHSANETGFRIERCIDGASPFVQVNNVAADVTTLTDTGLLPSTSYSWRVCAFNAKGNSPFSNVASFTTPPPDETLPAAPDGLTVTGVLANVSVRGEVGAGDAVLIAGFVVERGPVRVLVRAIGPGLLTIGLPGGTLADPRLRLVRFDGVEVGANDDWSDAVEIVAAQEAAGAFALAAGSRDAALIATLEPGLYTAIVSGADGAAGLALAEVYRLSN